MNRLAVLLCLVGVSYLTLWGCGVVLPNAPMSVVSPRGAYEDGSGQLSFALGVSGGKNPYANDAPGVGCGSGQRDPYGNGYEDCAVLPEFGFTYLHHISDGFAIGGGAHYAYDQTLAGIGGMLRGTWLKTERVRWGGDFTWGFFYATVASPVAIRLAQPVWIYVAPRAELSSFPRATLPLGVSIEVAPGWAIDAQVSAQLATLGYQDYPAPFGYGAFFGVDARF